MINMMSSYLFCYTKKIQHYKIKVLGLWVLAGGPCKSEDTTEWGLKGVDIILKSSRCTILQYVIRDQERGCLYIFNGI